MRVFVALEGAGEFSQKRPCHVLSPLAPVVPDYLRCLVNFIIREVFVLVFEEAMQAVNLKGSRGAQIGSAHLQMDDDSLKGGLVDNDGVFASVGLFCVLPQKCDVPLAQLVTVNIREGHILGAADVV